MQGTHGIVLAAGLGTRMRSSKAKALHEVVTVPMLYYTVEAMLSSGCAPVHVVIGHQGEEVAAAARRLFPDAPLSFVVQAEQLGTGHAALMAEEATRGARRIALAYADGPWLTAAMLRDMGALLDGAGEGMAIGTMTLDDPTGYGRILRDDAGMVARIVEERDTDGATRDIQEINVGLYVATRDPFYEALHHLGSDNAQGELYLTDAVALLQARGMATVPYDTGDLEGILGINDRRQLAQVSDYLRGRILDDHMAAGVTILAPGTVTIGPRVTLAPDVVIGPGSLLRGTTVVEEGARIESGAVLTDTHVGRDAWIKPYVVAEDASIGPSCAVGPFAHLRPKTVLEARAKVGNFVETKKTRLGEGSKASHLSYLGDATIGRKVNVGAGTITCNYDGYGKHQTVLEDEVFIGSDTQLVAPVTVGKGALVGAGTTVVADVPPDAVVVSRAPQVVKEGAASRFMDKAARRAGKQR